MTLDAWKDAGHAFSYQGHTVFYRDDGAGEALVCLHGFPTASWDWHRLWPALTARFRVVAPDMTGFGFSDKPRRYEYSLFDQATMHEALLAHLGLDAAHLLAHDYGDALAQELLARHHERQTQGTPRLRIRSVCLLNGGIFPEATRPRPIQRLLKGPLGGLVARFMTEARFRDSFRAVFGPQTQPTEDELADFWRLITWKDGVRVAPRISRYQDERRRHRARWVGALQHTAVPLRLVNGTLDPVSGAATVARYRDLIPDPDVVVLDDVGHYPQIEAPERVLTAFFAFVDRAAG